MYLDQPMAIQRQFICSPKEAYLDYALQMFQWFWS